MDMLAAVIARVGNRWDELHVTMDCHQKLHIAHEWFWLNHDGKRPTPFSIITPDDIEADIWFPRFPNAKPAALAGQTLREYAIYYTKELQKRGNKALMIWPVHCEIGHPGNNLYAPVATALDKWAEDNFATVNLVSKGSDPFTEHFGGLQAEVPLASDPSTSLRTDVLDSVSEADVIAIGGLALSHCVMETVNQIVNNIDPKLVSKFHILRDCTSPVSAVPGGPDFPALSEEWLKKMTKLGMTVTTSDKFLK